MVKSRKRGANNGVSFAEVWPGQALDVPMPRTDVGTFICWWARKRTRSVSGGVSGVPCAERGRRSIVVVSRGRVGVFRLSVIGGRRGGKGGTGI